MSAVDVLAVMDRAIENLQGAGVIGNTIGMREARAAVAELIEADGEAIDTIDSLIHAMALPVPDELHMRALRSELPALLQKKRAALARTTGAQS